MSPTGIEHPLRSLGLSGFSDKTTGLFQSMDYVPMFSTGIEPLSLSSFLDKTTGLFQSMDYVPTFSTRIEPLSLSSSSNETNGLSQNKDSVPNDFSAITTSSFLQLPNDSPEKQPPVPHNSPAHFKQLSVPMTTTSTGLCR
jgi:hypothetical protein